MPAQQVGRAIWLAEWQHPKISPCRHWCCKLSREPQGRRPSAVGIAFCNPPKEPMDKRYAETVIDNPQRFNSIEVHDMYRFLDRDGAEQYETANDPHEADMYSVYAHLKDGGIDCCGDFNLREAALSYGDELAELHGWPLCDFTTHAS